MAFILSVLWTYFLPALLAAATYWVVKTWLERRNQPKGPLGFPIVGYLPFMSMKTHMHQLFIDMGKKYGDILQLSLGQMRMVVLNKAEDVKEVFKNAEFSYRPETILFDIIKEAGERNITFASGERWRLCRKLASRGFSIFSTDRNSQMEQNLYPVAEWFCKQMRSKEAVGESVALKNPLMRSSGAMISSTVFGSAPDPEHPFIGETLKMVFEFLKKIDGMMIVMLFPQLEWIFRAKMAEARSRLDGFVGHIRQEMKNHNYDGTVRTVADSMLKAVEEVDPKEKALAGVTDDDIKDCVLDLFDAGFFVMSESLEWLFLLIAMHPEVQTKLHLELDKQMATEDMPTISNDYNNLIYMRACVAESLRFATSQPLGVQHACIRDTEYRGMTIPAGVQIVGNLYAINHDPQLFDQPDKFIPDRFVRPDGSFNSELSEKVITFSSGKRRCIGEQFAKHQLFLFTAFVMCRMSIRLDMTSFEKNPILGAPPSISYPPGAHKLFFKSRKSVIDPVD